ncbi:MAG: NAD(P)H-hydrate dehydratase [Candidatus Aegiribacteria sp.]|nr:NAD(P)H-hydrate dehydratase [Candidatus Aegiribacteria sp.]
MRYWVTPFEMSKFDARAVKAGTPGDVLMERAGTAAAIVAMAMTQPDKGHIQVWCGPGNNGGDGLVLARQLKKRGYEVCAVLATTPGKSLSHNCQSNLGRFVQSGGKVLAPQKLNDLPDSPALVVDSLLGTGFSGKLKDVFAECTDIIRHSHCKVLAIDTPTGVNGKTGSVDPHTPRADTTVTFAAPKAGLLLPPGCGYTGNLLVPDIGIDIDHNKKQMVLGLSDAFTLLPDRPADAHKGTFGRLLLIGGSENMPGAPQLMSLGALRSGAGLVFLSVPLPANTFISGRIPEVISSYFLPGDPSGLPKYDEFDAIAIGPGMGNSPATMKIVSYILQNWKVPLVLDADALNVLNDPVSQLSEYKGSLLLTPHPGELSRMTKCNASNIGSRSKAAAKLSASSGAVVLLKGKPSMVFSPDGECCLIPTGNTGLATGGSGDVLTGITSSLMAQGLKPFEAAILGAYVHGLSADIAIEHCSERSLIPSDVISNMGRAFRTIENGSRSELLTPGGKWRSEYAH